MRILHFEVIQQLGVGGMGEVHLAKDLKLDRKVALKFLPDETARDPERLRRFRSEAQVLASLNHPNIVTIHSVEQEGERLFLVMELVEGSTLAERLRGRPLRQDEFFDLAIALADALAAAHERGIVHRDLKPTNVMITREGVPKILDFGIAKLCAPAADAVSDDHTTQALTREGRILGTPVFMSPEQLEGRPLDQRSDIFTLGAILYEMATGKRPFAGETEAEIVSSILKDRPEPADRLQPGLPHHVGRLLRLCLEKDVDHRLQSARDLRNELLELRRELTTGEIAAPTTATANPAVAPRKRFRTAAAALAAVALIVMLGVWQVRRLSPEFGDSEVGGPEVRALLDQARLMEMRGDTLEDLAAAEDRYRRALELEPQNPKIQARLALVLARAQMQYPEAARAEEIRDLAALAQAADPGLALAHLASGTLELLDGRAEAAQAAASKAIELDPAEYLGHVLLGKALLAQGRDEAGLAELRQAVDLAGADVRARLALAKALQDLGRRNESASEYEKILAYAPDYPNALNNLALIYARSGREREAIPLFKRLLRVRRYEGAANNLGMIYMRQGRLAEAIEAFEDAYEIDPSKPVIPHSLGEAYEQAGDLETARRWFETAFESYSRDLEAGGDRAKDLALRAVCAAKLGSFDLAVRDINEALELAPKHRYRLFNAAQVHALAGHRDEAYRFAQLALDGGYPPDEFMHDPSFAAYWQEPDFVALLELDSSR